jgi:3-phenylpropionate/trans-cinnamate dioxygenase ferredoxin reductase subunit
MAQKETYVIVGANLCGGRAVETLRQEGFDGRVVLIGAEPERPYERPPLSKELLRGEGERERIFLRSPEFYAEQEIELRLGVRVSRIDVRERAVALEKSERLGFDKLLIATGGRVRRLRVPGAELERVYYLRTVVDCERIAAELGGGRRVVVIGAGFIGAEVAASARMKGLEVTLLEKEEVPLGRALGAEMGRIFADIHRERGIDLRLGTGVERLEGARRVERVVTSSDQSVECDFVVVGVGIDPETELVERTDIQVGNGIIVDEYCRTNVEGILAAGDVANFPNPILGERIRVEHWSNAQNQGVAAAKAMLGFREPYAEVPWFWSDQYDMNMQYVGHASSWDQIVIRGDVQERRFTAFYLKGGRLRAAMAMNRARDIRPCRELIQAGVQVDAKKLQDEEVNLRSLVGPA